jgi:hypothetical protein
VGEFAEVRVVLVVRLLALGDGEAAGADLARREARKASSMMT